MTTPETTRPTERSASQPTPPSGASRRLPFSAAPEAFGLYDPRFEHDACGVSFVANIKGVKSHEIIRQAIARAEADLNDEGRVLVRASGTEPKIRVMVGATPTPIKRIGSLNFSAMEVPIVL